MKLSIIEREIFNSRSKGFFIPESVNSLKFSKHLKLLKSLIMKNLSIIFLLALAVTANAQTKSIKKSPPLSEDAPESVGMSSERLVRIDDMCKEAVLNDEIPGIVALIAREGKIVYHKAFGMADNTSGRSLKPDDIFRIASQSKAITATAVMMLWEDAKFSLDEPISKYIPEFNNPQVLDTFQQNDRNDASIIQVYAR